MICTEFRRQFHRMLDMNQPRMFSGDMADHLRTCPDCAAHVQDMEAVDAALRNAPDIEVPLDLERKLQAIPDQVAPELRIQTWSDEIPRAAVYIVPAALLAILGLMLTPDFQFVIQTALATLAFITIVLQRIRQGSELS
jgi:anti-sigma factor RsiW